MVQSKKMTVQETEIYTKISKLPEDLRNKVNDFVESLLQQSKGKRRKSKSEPERGMLKDIEAEKPEPKFGALKGMFIMAEDFDEPLEDFKEYM